MCRPQWARTKNEHFWRPLKHPMASPNLSSTWMDSRLVICCPWCSWLRGIHKQPSMTEDDHCMKEMPLPSRNHLRGSIHQHLASFNSIHRLPARLSRIIQLICDHPFDQYQWSTPDTHFHSFPEAKQQKIHQGTSISKKELPNHQSADPPASLRKSCRHLHTVTNNTMKDSHLRGWLIWAASQPRWPKVLKTQFGVSGDFGFLMRPNGCFNVASWVPTE